MTNIVNMRDIIIEYCGFDEETPPSNILLDESFDDCLYGVSAVCNSMVPAYNYNTLIKKLEESKNISNQEAIDYFNESILDKYEHVSFICFMDKSMKEYSKYNEDMLFFDDMNSALVGFKLEKNNEIVAAYDRELCIESLTNTMEDYDSAYEWFEYNTTQSYVGENTPCILYNLQWI
jgi:hypothetical protein